MKDFHKLFLKGKLEIIQRSRAMYFIKNYISLDSTKTILDTDLYIVYQMWLREECFDHDPISLAEFLELIEFKFDISTTDYLPLISRA